MKKGDRVYVSGNSDELWIEDYDVNVSSERRTKHMFFGRKYEIIEYYS